MCMHKANLLMHFTDAQKFYWMHGCPSSHITRVHALYGANSWSVKKKTCYLANQIKGILFPILSVYNDLIQQMIHWRIGGNKITNYIHNYITVCWQRPYLARPRQIYVMWDYIWQDFTCS